MNEIITKEEKRRKFFDFISEEYENMSLIPYFDNYDSEIIKVLKDAIKNKIITKKEINSVCRILENEYRTYGIWWLEKEIKEIRKGKEVI